MGGTFIKLLQSPLVAEVVAVAATAALAALAEHGFTTSGEGSRGKRAGKAVKQAGKAAAAAVGRRLANELRRFARPLRSAQKRKPSAACFALDLEGQLAGFDGIAAAGFDADPAPGASQPALLTACTTALPEPPA